MLALGAGALVALSLPPWGFWPLAFVGVALFEVSLGADPTPRQRAARGWLFAAAWLFPGMGWMWFLTAPGYLVAGSLFAALHALAAVAAPTGAWRVIGRPAAHALVEGVRLVVPFGGVPLATLAIGQASGPLLDVARVGGVVLLSWVVLQVGFAIGALRSRQSLTGLVAATAVVAVALVAPRGVDTGTTLRIAVVQGGGPQGTRAIDTSARDVVERHLEATALVPSADSGDPVDMVLWPENVVDVATFVDSRERVEIAAEAARIGAPILVGITEDVAPSAELPVGGFLNAQVVVATDGEVTSRYDKVRRVPFGEYMPLRDALAAIGAPVDQVPRDAVAGADPAVLDLPDGSRVAVVISWEVFFGDRAREGVDRGGQLVVNPTNGSSYTGTILQTQQVASSRLRATETGRWVVQAAPTGFSAFVTDEGEVIDRTSVSEQAVIIHEVPLRGGTTWYVALGDVPFWALMSALLALAWSRSRSASRQASR
jgi:apolipoprotein N-acyltransferase